MIKKYFELNNGVKIPSIGFGTYKTPDGEMAINAIKKAIEVGYRHMDTAAIYENEVGVGKGVQLCGVDRAKIFVTSKVWNTERGYQSTLDAFEKTLQDLGLEYLDLYLIHWPANAHQFDNWRDINANTWRAMEQLYAAGKIKAIGVSNFLPHHLESLMQNATVMPAVNQIEFHPGFTQSECVKFCFENNILVEGWRPFGKGDVFGHEVLKVIAEKHHKSVAQICIRWALQNHVLPLPKSVTPSRIQENFEVFDFEISSSDMDLISQIDDLGYSGLNPDTVDF
ncbi:aldo/keto reductase [Putridiphycobacter roseus]|uniref:Aldo/keto reductase n=1 Tax=Putridiphycobacter roseus TaxID=2219161 RepID=A0A2W1NF25_9FLAO|nr:aldo/keto reductase [Putridiphycobacter roseus]PZE18075.1 aldo/keto reductase [Putridiphycobacter roseus]